MLNHRCLPVEAEQQDPNIQRELHAFMMRCQGMKLAEIGRHVGRLYDGGGNHIPHRPVGRERARQLVVRGERFFLKHVMGPRHPISLLSTRAKRAIRRKLGLRYSCDLRCLPYFGLIDDILRVPREEWVLINAIGPVTADEIITWAQAGGLGYTNRCCAPARRHICKPRHIRV